MSTETHGHMTVGRLRGVLAGFQDDAVVVVSTGIGYEEPKVTTTTARAVLVPQRYSYDRKGQTVIALVGVNGS